MWDEFLFLFNQLHQLSVAVHYVVFHLVRRDLGEEFTRAVDLAVLDLA